MMDGGKNSAKYGNRIGYIILQFPIVIHNDPLDYVRQGKTIAARKKKSLEAVSTYFTAELILRLFGIKVFVLFLRYVHICSFSLTNISWC
jgi:WS/DGAT C-terminal domain